MQKLENGEKLKEVYDLSNSNWREAKKISLEKDINVLLEDSAYGEYSWSVMGSTLMYAADLIPEIADDIVNVDRAMKWGFAWAKGPFEMIDELGPFKCIEKCKKLGEVPRMLKILEDSGVNSFYTDDGKYLDISGTYKKITD